MILSLTAAFGKVGDAHEADIAAAMCALVARVAQTCDEFHGQVRMIRRGAETQTVGRQLDGYLKKLYLLAPLSLTLGVTYRKFL
jgi:hypothetical protein